jgi:hypothetical protein
MIILMSLVLMLHRAIKHIYGVNKCNQLDGDFKDHAAGSIQHNQHHPMERNSGFTRSH